MKKKGLMMVCVLLAVLISSMAFFTGCDKTPEDTTPKDYTIQYTDDSGTHQFTVTSGMPYALDIIPEKTGFAFAGLFDAEVGGTQYVSARGASLSPFTDGKNMVLFPQFKAKDYTIILDYQGAAITGSRQLTVAYGSSLPELPKNLTGEHKQFAGWYTKSNCEGVQISDQYGLIPVVSVLNDTNFDLKGAHVYLYAGFEIDKFTVTCCFEAGMDTEDVQVEYDTPVSQIVPKTRVNGNAPLTWSKTQGGEVFNGKVTDDMVLYAAEYAPIIELDPNGGSKVNSVVARTGSTIILPTPTKDMAKFAYWEDMRGNKYTSTTMPSKSISLKAVWQAKLVFDENGGSDVEDISAAAGNSITLPSPEKDEFVFAGWYTAEKEQYISTTMPSIGLKVKAGWYKSKTSDVRVINADKSERYFTTAISLKESLTIDMSSFLPNDFYGLLELKVHLRSYNEDASLSKVIWTDLSYYSEPIASGSTHLYTKRMESNSTKYVQIDYDFKVLLQGNKIYGAIQIGRGSWYFLTDYYVEVTYPDTTNLYL